MNYKSILKSLLVLIIISFLIVYWILPYQTIKNRVLIKENERNYYNNSNFNPQNNSMQFYPNMRFPKRIISYKISSACSIQKREDMMRAFEILSRKTVLSFFPVSENEEISIFCGEKDKKIGEGRFIAGEGGPTNITVSGKYNVITHGNILLIRESKCPLPTVAIHELLHVLGFKHSNNSKNIMYPITNCDQEIGEDVINEINRLYNETGYPDLSISKAEARIKDGFLYLNILVQNIGLEDAPTSKLIVYVNGRKLNEFNLSDIKIGVSKEIRLRSSRLYTDIDEIEIKIETPIKELNKSNNEMLLK